jgi:hypothetical protein
VKYRQSLHCYSLHNVTLSAVTQALLEISASIGDDSRFLWASYTLTIEAVSNRTIAVLE